MKNVMRKILSTVLATSVVVTCFTATAFAAATPAGVSYSAHVQDIGWQAAVADGATAGTTGQSKRVEALKINLTNAPAGAKIAYQVHVQDHGWMTAVSNGELAGTTGESKRLEAIAIALSGMPGYSIEYCVHVQDIGWTSWVKNGAIAGTVGQSKRIEAIRIRLVTDINSISVTPAMTLTAGGAKGIITAAVDPASAANNISWSSNNTASAIVSNGVVTPVAAGIATITASIGEKTATCLVTVTSSASISTPITAIAAISGTAQMGVELTAGALTPAGATAGYQWKISPDGITYTDISGATTNKYTPSAADIGQYIQVTATGTGSYTGTATSAATATVGAVPITAIGAISGTAQMGVELTAGALTPAGATAGYQWQISSNGTTYTNISGATTNKYTPVAGDVGQYIKVTATGTGSYSGTATSAATAAVAAAPITAIAAISGTAQMGVELTAGALTPAGATAGYQWLISSNGTTYTGISGATTNKYTPVADDVGKYLLVTATGTGSYSGTVTSAATEAVSAAPITAIGAISGTAQMGVELTAGALTPAGATASYQWKISSNGTTYTDISGATTNKYTPVAGDVGKYIEVTATSTGSYSGTATSAATAAVAAAPITAIAAISGTAQMGVELTAGALTPAGATADYQWKISSKNGATYTDISGAITNKYTPVAGDVGKYIEVTATGTGSYFGTVTSAAIAAVAAAPTFTSAAWDNNIYLLSISLNNVAVGSSFNINQFTYSDGLNSYKFQRNYTQVFSQAAVEDMSSSGIYWFDNVDNILVINVAAGDWVNIDSLPDFAANSGSTQNTISAQTGWSTYNGIQAAAVTSKPVTIAP